MSNDTPSATSRKDLSSDQAHAADAQPFGVISTCHIHLAFGQTISFAL